MSPLIIPTNNKAGNTIKDTIDGFKSPFKGKYFIESFHGISTFSSTHLLYSSTNGGNVETLTPQEAA